MGCRHGRGHRTRHDLQLDVGGTNGIYCWDPATGNVTGSITAALPWTATSQRGLAYSEEDDTFYVGGWNEGVIYHVKGLSYSDKGAVISQCAPPDPSISGLAYNGSANVLWAATNSDTDTIYELDPDDVHRARHGRSPSGGFLRRRHRDG